MKIEFTRAEIERIILAHANSIAPCEQFNTIEGSYYRSLPDTITVSTTKEENAAQ